MKMVAHGYTVVIGLGGMLVALATLITAEAAEAAPIAYNVQANLNYGSVRAFACSRTMWSRATGSSVAIRTRSFEERFSVTTIMVGRSRAHKWRPRQHAYDWPVHTANVARSFGRYSNSHSAQRLSQ